MRILVYLLALFIIGCEVPQKSYKKRSHRSAKTVQRINPTQITSDQHSIIVPKAWMDEYKSLEKKHWEIEADSQIWSENNRYHIPVEVAQHYIFMKGGKP